MKPRDPGLKRDLPLLLLGVVLGMGTNLVTANAQQWPALLRPIDTYAPYWLSALTIGAFGSVIWLSRRGVLHRTWSGSGNPYPGLEPFDSARSGVFFGRRTEAEELVDRIVSARQIPALRFIPIVGPSGCGKSSLIQAGVLPTVNKRGGWQTVGPILPGTDPIQELCRISADPQESADARTAAEQALRSEADTLLLDASVGAPYRRPRTLIHRLQRARGEQRRLLLVIDQFEELVTLSEAGDRQRILALLEAALTFEPRFHVLVSLRAEFLVTFQAEYGGSLFTHPYGLGVLPRERIREVIVGPARAADVSFEDGLVELMLSEAHGGDVLPLLGYLLQQLYSGATDQEFITLRDYDNAGRIAGAIAHQADQVLDELSAVYDPTEILETLLRFVTWEGPEPTRRRVSAEELGEQERRIVAEFRDARLIIDDRPSQLPTSAQTAMEFDLAHEALLRQWEPLNLLVRSREAAVRRRTELEPLALVWERSGRRADYLIRGSQLREAAEGMDHRALSPVVERFVRTSLDRQREERRTAADRLADQSLELAERDPQLALTLAHVAVAECAATIYARMALQTALENPLRDVWHGHVGVVWSVSWSRTGQLASAGGDGTVQVWPTESAGATLTLAGHGTGAFAVAWSPDGGLASGGGDGVIRVRRTGDTDAVVTSAGGRVLSLAWSRDGRLAGGNSEGAVQVWDPGTGAVTLLPGHVGDVNSVEWSPDGRLATGGADGRIRVWDIGLGEAWEATLDDSGVWAVGWSPLGRLAAGGGSGSVWLWERDRTEPAAELPLRSGGVFALSWSAQEVLACAGDDGIIRVWNRGTAARPLTLNRQGDEVFSLTWSAAGLLASCGGHDGAVRVWDPSRRPERALAVAAAITGVSWNGPRLAVAMDDGRIEVRPAALDEVSASTTVDAGTALSVTWLDGDRLAVSDGDRVWIWDTAAPAAPAQVPGVAVRSIAWADGRLAGGGPDGIVRVLHGDDWREIAALGGHNGAISAVSWSVDGLLAAGGTDGVVRVWHRDDWREVAALSGHSGAVSAVAWSADGLLASGGADGTVLVWRPDQDRQVAADSGHNGAVSAVTWSADGLLASGGADGTVRVRHPIAGTHARILAGDSGAVASLSWAVGGALAAGASDGVLLVWELAVPADRLRDDAAGLTIRPMSAEERHHYRIPE
ncbi:NACHT and WD repeat domain-containing protein [Nocardia sp. NPDC057663]|uniref:NACHT and WD repeat domain-containing protein n=1 Tax=Nocardia sp. NPDC057663 TaxID=3346201 RepID=UPI00366DCB69